MAKYRAIKEAIAGQINRGELRSGDQIMPVRMLMREYKASYATVSKALSQLNEAGLVQQVWGKGIFVRDIASPSKNLAVTFDSVYQATHPFLTPVLQGVGEAAGLKSWQIQIYPLSKAGIFGGKPEPVLVPMLREGYIGGVVVCSPHPPSDIRRLEEMGISTVSVNMEYTNEATPCVMPDIPDGVEQIIDHLQGLGHTKIGLVMGQNLPHSAQVALASSVLCDRFRVTMRERGLQFRADWLIYSDNAWDVARPKVESLLKSKHRPTALVFISDLLAQPAIELAEYLGLSVPADLSVVSWGDSENAGLTRARIDLLDVGREAFNCVEAQIASTGRDDVRMPVQLVVGETTTIAPANASLILS